MNDVVLYTFENGIARVTLNRPDKLNSFSLDMHHRLKEVLQAVSDQPGVRCMLLTGSGRGFCAGQDLSERDGDERPDLGATLEAHYNPYVQTIHNFPFPVVCAVNGVAAGAGANLALSCDLVLAKESAKFIQAFCKIGLLPDCSGTWFLPRLVGLSRALGLSLLGDAITAPQAEQWGMIWRSIADEAFDEEVEKLVQHLAIQPTRGLALAKQALRASINNSLSEQLDLERDLQRAAGQTDDYREGVKAFLGKRTPKFVGE